MGNDGDGIFGSGFLSGLGGPLGYEGIPELMGYMIDHAIKAELEHHGFKYIDGYIYGPSWQDKQADGVDPDSAAPADLFFGGDVEKALAFATAKWNDKITSAFQDYFPVPDPEWFKGDIERVNAALSSLAIFAQYGQGGDAGVTANPDLAGAITTLEDRTGELRGQYIEVFSEYYASKVGPVVSTLGASIYPLALALSGEQAIWTRTRASLATVAEAARDAFRESGPDGTSLEDIKNGLAIAGAVLSVVAIPLTGGASLAAGAAAAAIGVTSTALDFLPPETPKDLALGGDHPDEVHAKLLVALEDINTQIRDEEYGIRNTINALLPSITGSNDERINIARPGIIDADDSNSVLTKGSIRNNRGIVDRLAHDHIPLITATVTDAAGQLDSDPGIWTRSDLGLGTIGPWADYDYLRGCLVPKMKEVSAELDRAGRILWESYLLIEGADDAADHDLRSLQKNLPPVPGGPFHLGG